MRLGSQTFVFSLWRARLHIFILRVFYFLYANDDKSKKTVGLAIF